MKVLVTGAAGFIGFHLSRRLAADSHHVLGLDNFSDYYDPDLKRARVRHLRHDNIEFHPLDITDETKLHGMMSEFRPDIVVHLAAQVGVRHSVTNPHSYIHSNVRGFLTIVEGCR